MKAGTLMFRDVASHFFLLSLSCGSPRYEVRDDDIEIETC